MKHIYDKQKILVTGGAGFIGSFLTEQLVTLGAKVTVADNLSRGSLKNLKKVLTKIKFEKLDLRIYDNNLKITRNQDLVFNLAAINTGIDFDIGRTQYMFEENMLLQMLPLKASAQNQVKRFVQLSTASIYSTKVMEKNTPIKETDDAGTPENSKLGYALAKRMGEQLALWYGSNSGTETIIARLINVFGPRDNFDNKGHFIPIIIKKFLTSDTEVEVFGSGNQKRSFMYVLDAIEALLIIGEKGLNREIYNVDPQDEHTIKEIVNKIKTLINSRANIVFNHNLPEGSKKRILNNRKIIKLGWKPKYTINTGLPKIIKDISFRFKNGNS
jgi:nucleoside-diphosphate-sugar epimerase